VYAAYFFASLFYALGLAQVKGKKLSPPLSLPSWLSGLLNLNQARAFHQVRIQLNFKCGVENPEIRPDFTKINHGTPREFKVSKTNVVFRCSLPSL
jgi:hypothetical protein